MQFCATWWRHHRAVIVAHSKANSIYTATPSLVWNKTRSVDTARWALVTKEHYFLTSVVKSQVIPWQDFITEMYHSLLSIKLTATCIYMLSKLFHLTSCFIFQVLVWAHKLSTSKSLELMGDLHNGVTYMMAVVKISAAGHRNYMGSYSHMLRRLFSFLCGKSDRLHVLK